MSNNQRVRVFVTMLVPEFGFTTEIDEPNPETVDGLAAVVRAVVRYNEWFDAYGDEFSHTYRHIDVDDRGLPQGWYQHLVIQGGHLISFEHHLDLDAYRGEHGMDPDRCEACAGNVVAGKACYACGLIGPAGAGVPVDPTGGTT